jgi:hypothetical protein
MLHPCTGRPGGGPVARSGPWPIKPDRNFAACCSRAPRPQPPAKGWGNAPSSCSHEDPQVGISNPWQKIFAKGVPAQEARILYRHICFK